MFENDLGETDTILNRHQLRRQQGLPTVTVFRGPIAFGFQAWREWNRNRSVQVVFAKSQPLEEVRDWVVALASQIDFKQTALDWLANRAGEEPGQLAARLAGMTDHDFERFWQANHFDAETAPTIRVYRWLGMNFLPGRSLPTRQLAEKLLDELFPGVERDGEILATMGALTSPERLPALILASEGMDDPRSWMEKAAQRAGTWAVRLPALPVAIAASDAAVEAYLQSGPSSHAQVMVREGAIRIHGLDESALSSCLKRKGVDIAPFEETIRTLATVGAGATLANQFADAACQVGQQETVEQEDQARSAAERFLYEQLESLVETAGLFGLNQRLEFQHGPAAAEGDLVSFDLKLAIEIDGSYYHLKDREAYRRDRRKDWQFQRHGYLVLRFLAEDVVCKLEEILGTILMAVALRRTFFQPRE